MHNLIILFRIIRFQRKLGVINQMIAYQNIAICCKFSSYLFKIFFLAIIKLFNFQSSCKNLSCFLRREKYNAFSHATGRKTEFFSLASLLIKSLMLNSEKVNNHDNLKIVNYHYIFISIVNSYMKLRQECTSKWYIGIHR